MKILYIITRAERGGGQVHVADLLAGFREDHSLELAVGEDGYLADRARDLGIPVHILSRLKQPMAPLSDFAAIFQCVALIRRVRPDMIHAHTSKAGLVARLAGALTRTPVVFTAHTWSFAEGTSRRRRAICAPVERLCANLCARIITVSEANRNYAVQARVAGEDRMTTVWNGVPDVIERALPAQGEPLRVVMVARFADQKDQALLLRAAAMLDTVPFEIVFVGTGIRMEAARSLARALNLHSRVVFLGDRDDVASILAASHIFVLSTKWEGLPLSVIEAMRAGLPVVASNVGGMSELVKDGVTGIMVEPGDAESLAAALERLVLDPELRRRMGSQGRLRYETCFSYEGMLERTRHIYSEVLARPVVAGNAQYLPAEK